MKKIAVFGTGVVGKTIGTKLIKSGYEVMMGSRTVTNEKQLPGLMQMANMLLQEVLQMPLHLVKLFLIVPKAKLLWKFLSRQALKILRIR